MNFVRLYKQVVLRYRIFVKRYHINNHIFFIKSHQLVMVVNTVFEKVKPSKIAWPNDDTMKCFNNSESFVSLLGVTLRLQL